MLREEHWKANCHQRPAAKVIGWQLLQPRWRLQYRAAPLERCAELLGIDLAIASRAAAKVEPYIRADGSRSGT